MAYNPRHFLCASGFSLHRVSRFADGMPDLSDNVWPKKKSEKRSLSKIHKIIRIVEKSNRKNRADLMWISTI